MKRKTAIGIINKCVDYYVNIRLDFNANIYERGIDKDFRFKTDWEERDRIREALTILTSDIFLPP